MDVAASPNRPAEAGGDFVIAEIDVRAAAGTIGRRRLITDFVFAFAFETRNEAIALPAPHRLEPSMERQLRGRSRVVLELQTRLGRRRGKGTSALPANRRLRRHIFHLLKATVRAFHTGLGRRRFCH